MNKRALRERIAEILEDAGIPNEEVAEEIATTVVKLEMTALFDEDVEDDDSENLYGDLVS